MDVLLSGTILGKLVVLAFAVADVLLLISDATEETDDAIE